MSHSLYSVYNILESLAMMIVLYVCMYVFSACSEYYFSDENLQKDFFLRGQVCVSACML